jgi:hypothetical protein
MAPSLRDAPSYASLTSPDFDAMAEQALARTLARQAAFDMEWLPDGFAEWSCDQDEGVLRFVKADGTGIQATVQIVGSYASDSSTWEWGWNNPHVNEELSRDARVVRAYGATERHLPLTTGIIRATPEESQRLIGLAAALVNAQGVHWADAGDLAIAMTYSDVRTIARKDVRPPSGATAGESHADSEEDESPGLLSSLASWLLSSVLSLLFGNYYRHPTVLKRGAPTAAGARYFRLTADHLERIAPYLLEDMSEIEHALVEKGFAPLLRVANDDREEISRFVSLLEHPTAATIGFVMVHASQHIGVTRTTTFETRFADGRILYTTNFGLVSRTPSRPIADSVQLPDVTDVSALYELHRARVRERTVATVPHSRGDDPLGYLDTETREVQAFWVERGYYRWTPDERLAMTWRGAILSAWRGLFPWKQLTERRNARKREALMRRVGP